MARDSHDVQGAVVTGVAKVRSRAKDAAVSSVNPRAWRYALAIGAVVVAACAALPIDTAALVVEVAGAAGLVAFVRGARRNGAPDLVPFRLIAAGGAAFLVGNVVRVAHGAITGADAPFPS